MMQIGINLGRPAVIHMNKLALGASAAAALLFTAFAASAQLAPAPKAQPATPTAPAKSQPAPTPQAQPTTAKAAPKKAEKAASTSVCQGLDEKACGGKATECRWIAAVKRKDGKEQSAHCRGVPKSVKAAPKKAEAAPAAAKGAPVTAPAKAPAAATK